jgi:hypothetical protein
MSKKPNRSLRLASETLRKLSPAELTAVAGGRKQGPPATNLCDA